MRQQTGQIILFVGLKALYGVFPIACAAPVLSRLRERQPDAQGTPGEMEFPREACMSNCYGTRARAGRLILPAALALAGLLAVSEARGQFINQQVGGVSIDARGVLTKIRADELNELKRERQAAFAAVPADLKDAGLRKVSLRRLEAAIAELKKNGTPLGDDVRYLAGLQRIQYVFVYPDQQDIVIAGPAEGWKLNALGDVVGETMGEVIRNTTAKLAPQDLAAMIAYMRSLAPLPEPDK